MLGDDSPDIHGTNSFTWFSIYVPPTYLTGFTPKTGCISIYMSDQSDPTSGHAGHTGHDCIQRIKWAVLVPDNMRSLTKTVTMSTNTMASHSGAHLYTLYVAGHPQNSP